MIYTFDVETSYDGTRAWVWSYGLCDEFMRTVQGNGVGWVDAILKLEHGAEVWVHNLPFDGEFVFWALIEKGYRLLYDDDDGQPKHGFFTPRIDTSGMMSMTIHARGNRITLRDSTRLFRCPLRQLPKLCGFEDEVSKGEIDYDEIRPPDYVATPEERDYQIRDVIILMKAVKWIKAYGVKGNTVGAIALNDWKEFMGSSPFKPLTPEERGALRSLYVGGIVTCQTKPDVLHVSGRVYDRNSMYPAEACSELPVAVKRWTNAPPPRLVWSGQYAVHVIAKGLRLKPGGFPLLITPFTGAARKLIPALDKWIYWGEWCEVLRQYHVDSYEIVQSVEFVTADICREFVNKWYEIKKMNDERRTFSKFILNNLTGKFGEWDIHELYQREMVGGGYVSKRVNETRATVNRWAFMPAVALITSNSRIALMRAAQAAGMDGLLYTDTDSIHTLGTLPSAMVHESDLGAWKCEAEFTKACYIKPKSYWESNGERFVKRHAGLNADATVAECIDKKNHVYKDTGVLIHPDNMRPGQCYYTRVARKVPGGVVINREVKKI